MNKNDYYEILKKKFEKNFDIEKDVEFAGEKFDFKAIFNAKDVKYFVDPKWELYSSEFNEHHFVKEFNEEHTVEYLDKLMDSVVKSTTHLIEYITNHMATQIVIVLVADKFPEDKSLINYIKKYKKQQSSFLGLKGWVDYSIVIYSLSENKAVHSKKGSEMSKAYVLRERELKRYYKRNEKEKEE